MENMMIRPSRSICALIVAGAVLAACMQPISPAAEPMPEIPGAPRLLALGDSYTIGQGVSEQARWPTQLAARLREQGIAIGEPQIVARTGWTTDDLAGELNRLAPGSRYDLVSLLIGVNDQYGGRDAEQYRPRFRALLQRAIELAGGRAARVIVISIPDWGATPFADRFDRAEIAAELALYNQVNREETQRAGARYVDITLQSQQAAADRTLLADDRLHPSGKMYAEWVQLVLPDALAALERGAG
jgi:lysophospholipase L1-like esterase